MVSLAKKNEICAHCQGKKYVFANVKGTVQAKTCECFDCPHCEGDGRIFTQDERGISYIQDCPCVDFNSRLKRLNDAGIPGKFWQASAENFEIAGKNPSLKTAKSRAKDFAKDFEQSHPKKGLLFMGAPGLGKTHLAVGIIKQLVMDQGIDCKFVDFFQLLADIRHGYSENISEMALIAPYVKSQVLVIDELAKGRNTEWELTVLDQIISTRYNSGDKVTIFTTNYLTELPHKKGEDNLVQVDSGNQKFVDSLTCETLQEKIGSRIYSRLSDMCDFVFMQGQDHRQKKLPFSQQYPKPKKSR